MERKRRWEAWGWRGKLYLEIGRLSRDEIVRPVGERRGAREGVRGLERLQGIGVWGGEPSRVDAVNGLPRIGGCIRW